MIKPLLVGESPSRTGDRYWRFPLSGAPARTLCQAAGWPPDGDGSELGHWTWALYERFETINLIERWAQAERWSVVRARERADGLWASAIISSRPAVVLLGRRVAEAFEIPTAPYFNWIVGDPDLRVPPRLVVIPHPSGRNRLLNDPEIRGALGRTLREAVGPETYSR